MQFGITILLILIVLYTLLAERLNRYFITMPMVFVVVGALMGPAGLGILNLSLISLDLETLIEITLALLLFADASTLSFQRVRGDASLSARLLFITMPLTIVLCGLLALILVPSEGVVFALLLGSILAPTDAALGLPIFTNPKIPVRIRQALNVESGLNDGIATPFVSLFAILAVAEEFHSIGNPLRDALLEIGIAVGVAILIGSGGGWLFSKATMSGWTSKAAQQMAGITLALASYFSALTLGGNGFIAAFIAGLLFGYFARNLAHLGNESAEMLGSLFSLFVWTVFGVMIVEPILLAFNPSAFVYAILALVIVRMLAVAVAMLGKNLRPDTLLLMGWFGPRGLASVIFSLIALESFHTANLDTDLLVDMAGWTILLSVILHGLTARPLANWYARRLEDAPPETAELLEVSEIKRMPRNPG